MRRILLLPALLILALFAASFAHASTQRGRAISGKVTAFDFDNGTHSGTLLLDPDDDDLYGHGEIMRGSERLFGFQAWLWRTTGRAVHRYTRSVTRRGTETLRGRFVSNGRIQRARWFARFSPSGELTRFRLWADHYDDTQPRNRFSVKFRLRDVTTVRRSQ